MYIKLQQDSTYAKEINDKLTKLKSDRNIFFYPTITNDEKEINEIIIKYKEYNITYFELIDYNKYKINQINISVSNFNNTFQQYSNFDENIHIKEEIFNIKFEDFNIEDFDTWRIKNNKLKEKISESDYLAYLENRKTYDNKLEIMYKNNLDLIEYYFNKNNN